MSAGIEIYNYVSNQKGSPALYSDILANRPAAGFLGRLFISTDTLEIYRDTGTAWALISGGGGGSVNIYNTDGTLTAARTMTMANHSLTFEGGANDARLIMSANNNVPRIFSFRTANVARWDFRVTDNETGSDAGGNWYLRAHNDAGAFTFAPIAANRKTGEKTLFAQANITAGTEAVTSVFNIAGITYASGLTMIGGNAHAAQFNNFTLANSGSLTFANSSFVGANGNVLRLQANNSGTITMQAATPGLRTAAVSLNQIQYNTTNGSAITYTHAANIQGLGILQLFAAGSLTVTNAYGLLLNDLNEYGYPSTGAGALSITNRWGIYQDSTTDANYLGGSVLIGTTTNAGFKTDINGTFRAVSTVTLSSLGGVGTRMVVADASGVLSTQAIPGGGGGITGSGTTNFLAKFTGASSIGNSQIFDNGTNVGIGTTSPIAKFSVLVPFVNNGDVGTIIGGQTLSTSLVNIQTVAENVGNGATSMAFSTFTGGVGLSEKMRIKSDGELLIGTTSDAGDYKLQVSGNAYVSGTSLTTASVSNTPVAHFDQNFTISDQSLGVLIDGGTSANDYALRVRNTATAELFRITGAGNVGIATPTPGAILDINSGAAQAGYVTNLRLSQTGTTSSSGQQILFFNSQQNWQQGAIGSLREGGNANFALTFLTAPSAANTERMRITSSGNVLIGTTTDSGQRLQVAGTARIFGTALPHLLIEQTAATGNVELQFSANAAYTAIIRTQTGQAVGFRDGVSNSNLDIYSGSQISLGGGGAPFGSTNTVTIPNGTAPTSGTPLNSFVLYSNDITAGNAAPHFITENGAIVKIYQETTSVAAAAFTANSGTAINDASTFDGYTLRQIVKALRNLGILQ
jgi:hypothetical protein